MMVWFAFLACLIWSPNSSFGAEQGLLRLLCTQPHRKYQSVVHNSLLRTHQFAPVPKLPLLEMWGEIDMRFHENPRAFGKFWKKWYFPNFSDGNKNSTLIMGFWEQRLMWCFDVAWEKCGSVTGENLFQADLLDDFWRLEVCSVWEIWDMKPLSIRN